MFLRVRFWDRYIFIIYTNDFPLYQNHTIQFIFPDDSKLLVLNRSISDLNPSLNNISGLLNWANANLMCLNAKKTKCMKIFSKRKIVTPEVLNVKVNNVLTEEVKSFKLLGVHFDNLLTWDEQILHIYKNINKRLLLLKRIRQNLPHHSRIMFYESLIYSYLLYCCSIWRNATNELLNDLLKLQKRSVRIILEATIETLSVELFRTLNWITIHNLI